MCIRDSFEALSGGDSSITNSNSNFGQFSLAADGFKLDAFDKNGFIEKSGKMQGTVGDMLDYSAELSQERAERSETGEDPIKRKNFDDYEKRNGKKHLSDVKKTIETSKIRVDLD